MAKRKYTNEKYTDDEGNIYQGKFYDEGGFDGKIIWKDGDVYEGEFNDDTALIVGKKIFKDGDIYEGKFNDEGGLIEGKALKILKEFLSITTWVEEGIFGENNKLISGKKIVTHKGKIFGFGSFTIEEEGNWDSQQKFSGRSTYNDAYVTIYKNGEKIDGFDK